MSSLKQLGVNVILGERVTAWPEHPEILDGHLKTIVTCSGRQLSAEMILPCTGQKPHVALMASFRPHTICPITGRIRIKPSLQVDNSLTGNAETEDLSHIFACGDCAESGAIQAGHTAYWQGQQAAQNIVKMIAIENGLAEGPLGEYKPTHPAIKVTLGRVSPLYMPFESLLIASAERDHLQCRRHPRNGRWRRRSISAGYVVSNSGLAERCLLMLRTSHMVDDLPYDS